MTVNFVIAFDDKHGNKGYLIQRYKGGEYSLMKRTHRPLKAVPKPEDYHTREDATVFNGDDAIAMLTKIAERFPLTVERWFVNIRIELAS